MPDNTAAADYFADCEVIVTGRFVNQRVAPCPLEVRGSAATWVDGRLYQWLSTQHAQGAKASFAAANGVEPDEVRVITPDVGGGFGAKIGTYPEELLLGPISKALGRPVRWRETRSESMMGLGHGRAPGAVRHDRRHPRRQGHALPAAAPAGLRRLRRHRHRPGPGHDPADVVGRLRHPEHRGAGHVGRHQHDADGAVPRCRAAGGNRGDRAGDGHVRRRDRQGRRRGPPHEPHPEVPRATCHLDRPVLRRRRLRGRARQGARGRRLRRAARRAGAPPGGRRRQAARHRRQRLRRDHRWRRPDG